MSYTPINWQNGDTITAEKMNKMDNGWGVSSVQLFSETITTTAGQYGNSAQLSYSGGADLAQMTVTYDGDSYVCDCNTSGSVAAWGAPDPSDFSQYPFVLLFNNGSWMAYTSTAGTHTIAASQGAIEVSDSFVSATAIASPILIAEPNVTTWQEISDALDSNKIVVIFDSSQCFYVSGVGHDDFDRSTVYSMIAGGTGVGLQVWSASSDDSEIEIQL